MDTVRAEREWPKASIDETNLDQDMTLSNWTSELETGLAALDGDHKQLLAASNQLNGRAPTPTFRDSKRRCWK